MTFKGKLMFKTFTETNIETALEENAKILIEQLQDCIPIQGSAQLKADMQMNNQRIVGPTNFGQLSAFREDEQLAQEKNEGDNTFKTQPDGQGTYLDSTIEIIKQLNLVDALDPSLLYTPILDIVDLSQTGANLGSAIGTRTSAYVEAVDLAGTNVPLVSRLGNELTGKLYNDPQTNYGGFGGIEGPPQPTFLHEFPDDGVNGVDISAGFTLSYWFSRQINRILDRDNTYKYDRAMPLGHNIGFGDRDFVNLGNQVNGTFDFFSFSVVYRFTIGSQYLVAIELKVGNKFYTAYVPIHEEFMTKDDYKDPTKALVEANAYYQSGDVKNSFNIFEHPRLIGVDNRRLYNVIISWNPALPKAMGIIINGRLFNAELDETTIANPQLFLTNTGQRDVAKFNRFGITHFNIDQQHVDKNSYLGRVKLWGVPLDALESTIHYARYL